MSRKLRLLYFSPEILMGIIDRFSNEAVPEDMRMVGANYDPLRERFVMLLESDDFEPVEDGVLPPMWSPELSWPSPHWEQVLDIIKSALDVLQDETVEISAEGGIPTTADEIRKSVEDFKRRIRDGVLDHLARAYEAMQVTKVSGDDAGIPERSGL